MKLSVIVPTIMGREESLDRTTQAYGERTPLSRGVDYEIVIVRDRANWPTACNVGARLARGDVLHFGADDVEPLPGWWDAVAEPLATLDELPAPRVMNYSADGHHDNASDGPDGAFCHFTRVPIMRRDQYDRIGPWPEIDYCADVWVSERGRAVGIPTRLYYGYAFIHHWHQVGRLDSPERIARAEAEMQRLREAGL